MSRGKASTNCYALGEVSITVSRFIEPPTIHWHTCSKIGHRVPTRPLAEREIHRSILPQVGFPATRTKRVTSFSPITASSSCRTRASMHRKETALLLLLESYFYPTRAYFSLRWAILRSCREFAIVGRDVIATASGVYVRFHDTRTGETRVERFDGGERGDGAGCLAGLSVRLLCSNDENVRNQLRIVPLPRWRRSSPWWRENPIPRSRYSPIRRSRGSVSVPTAKRRSVTCVARSPLPST